MNSINIHNMKNILILILVILPLFTFSQIKKELKAVRTTIKPIIDGDLSDAVWENAPSATNFIQFEPNLDTLCSQKTEIKILYDNSFIYVYAKMYATVVDNISIQLTQRDNTGVADFIGISIDPFNDNKMNFAFTVTAAGVQGDMKVLENGRFDGNWDAVWKSKVKIHDYGWAVEYQIPYSAIRFPKQDIQEWGFNVFRFISEGRESAAWSRVKPSDSNPNLSNGILTGITNVKSPIRLSLSPFLATYAQKTTDSDMSFFMKGGLDLKYGINESFTLDMMLIPDFGQVQSDDQRLNLSPFELYFAEKRAFFTEGTELFSRADIFYSRRIGGTPIGYYDVYDNLGENEDVVSNPSELRLINASKITGKTPSGFSLGFLNAMSMKSVAQIEDTLTGFIRDYITQDFTNHNVIALEQTLKNNSYISFINTNYAIAGGNYMSNVTGTDFKISNKKNTYALYGKAALSYINNIDVDPILGNYYNLKLSKTSGNFQFSLLHQTVTDTYQNNDMGYLTRNNYNMEYLTLTYNRYKPKFMFLNYSSSIMFNISSQYKPYVFTNSSINYSLRGTLKNHLSLGLNIGVVPVDEIDYYETRTDGRYVIKSARHWAGAWISTNYNKVFAVDFNLGAWKSKMYNQDGFWAGFSPRLRINDKILIIYSLRTDFDNNVRGFVSKTDNSDTIYFGRRKVKNLTNTLDFNYIFNNKSSVSLRARYFRSTVDYDKYFILNEDGYFSDAPSDFSSDNINFNAFNIDMAYSLEFAPGSFISLVWKNEIYASNSNSDDDFFINFANTMQEIQGNSLSLKVVYYLDYLSIKQKNK